MPSQEQKSLSRAEIRNGVKDGLVDHDNTGNGFLLILIECLMVGVAIYFLSKDWNPAAASWLGWGSGLGLFFLFFIPKVGGFLIFAFSTFWGLVAYIMAIGLIDESREGGLTLLLGFLSTSPIPYVVAIITFLVSFGFHLASAG